MSSFTGETTIPAMPLLVNPADTVRLSLSDTTRYVLRYQADSATGALLMDQKLTKPNLELTRFVEVGDTIELSGFSEPFALALRLRGIGWNYTNWFKRTGGELVLPPWPSFGIEGEGVYGYFGGVSTPTRWVHIIVGEP